MIASGLYPCRELTVPLMLSSSAGKEGFFFGGGMSPLRMCSRYSDDCGKKECLFPVQFCNARTKIHIVKMPICHPMS